MAAYALLAPAEVERQSSSRIPSATQLLDMGAANEHPIHSRILSSTLESKEMDIGAPFLQGRTS